MVSNQKAITRLFCREGCVFENLETCLPPHQSSLLPPQAIDENLCQDTVTAHVEKQVCSVRMYTEDPYFPDDPKD